MKQSVLTTPKPNPVGSNPAHTAARMVCAAPLLLLLIDWTRAGEILESGVTWIALGVAGAAGLAKKLGANSNTLKLVMARVAKLAAGLIVGIAVQKGWLTPNAENEATAKLAELFAEGLLIVAAAIWVHADTKRELKTGAKLVDERQRTGIALDLPAGSTREDVEAVRAVVNLREVSNETK